MGWFSHIENPLITKISLFIWARLSEELDLKEARTTRFKSLHECFIRELKDGARPVDQDVKTVASPCDAVVGVHGKVEGVELIQAKGFPYTLMDLLCDEKLVEKYRDGVYVTLRLKSTMYHRFHAPVDCGVSGVTYISGDTWNVNPVALKRVERLYCKNERVVINLQLDNSDASLTLVPVAAILVASIRLNFLEQDLNLKYKGPNHITCDATFHKGQQMGYFQHGSTIIVFGTKDFEINPDIEEGSVIRMGQPLLQYR
jgi:phosphatidylserine decarboxylase